MGNVCTPVWGVLRGLTGWQCMLALGLCAACVVWPVAPCVCVCTHSALSVCCWVRHARVVQCGCLLLGVCETFQRVSQRGYTSPFVLQGPNLGNLVACVLLMNNATMPSFIHSYITCQTSVTNILRMCECLRRVERRDMCGRTQCAWATSVPV